MSYKGRFQLGDWLPLSVQCTDGSGYAIAPDAAPTVDIYNASGTIITTAQKLPPVDWSKTGWFGMSLFLGSTYAAAGQYCARYAYTHSTGTAKVDIDVFTILAGGNAKGAYTSLKFFDTPQAPFLVGGLEDGTIETRRGPYIP